MHDKPGKLQNVACLTIDVREHNNEIIFMHKIVAGVANRSYGIHVARMAGMPTDVVERAAAVLSDLETRTSFEIPQQQNCTTSQKNVHSGRIESPGATTKQLDLFR